MELEHSHIAAGLWLVVQVAWNVLYESAAWLMLSFIIAGLVHELLPAHRMQSLLDRGTLRPLVRATAIGSVLPMCSCGVIPLGISLYYSGARLGTALAFMVATPIINPAAVILAFGLLGTQLATAYLVFGLTVPIIVGLAANALAGPALYAPGIVPNAPPPPILTASAPAALAQRVIDGMRWAFLDLGSMVAWYLTLGSLAIGVVVALVPEGLLQTLFGADTFVSLLFLALLTSAMYVCAVAHIPMIATLLGTVMAPGGALVYLIAGVSTNIPELISIWKLMGRRAALIYPAVLIVLSVAAGLIVNLLIPAAAPAAAGSRALLAASHLNPVAPPEITYLSLGFVLALFLYACVNRLTALYWRLLPAPAS